MHVTPSLPPAFQRLAWSNLLAQAAEQIGLATAPLLAVFLFQANTGQTSTLQTIQSLPFLLLAIPAGLLADRSSRRVILAAAEGLRAFSFGLILLLLATQNLTLAALAWLGFVGAAGTVVYNVTVPGMVPLLVDRPSLPQANGRLELARSIAFTAGPGLAGLLFSAVGAPLAYVLALLLSLAAMNFLRALPGNVVVPQTASIAAALREGLIFTFRHDLLRPTVITAVIFNTSWFLLQAAYVPYAVEHLGLSAAQVGSTLAAYGVGMVSGALVAPWIGKRLRFGSLVIIGPVSAFVGALIMAGTIRYSSLVLAWISFFLFGAGPVIWAIATATLRQAVTPQALMSRVSAVIMTLTYGARPAGAAIAVVIGTRYGAATCMVAAAVGFGLQLMMILSSRVPRLPSIPAGHTA
ncbi:MFS transporter [Pigmentiphaga aceris]|uniref:MFS transporter n=1 Tax=Pigmentiphaga aceris TaxID=1940612 RepID=A0A5C0AYU9_9BURK|nr:MFS transporter [Pigmentiphaga aceris]QEI06754.1 MFS transporter [Pigmentiphaga aceris]